jgi:HPt (histidine-containing phosphotransfer) domain-containing protein
VSDDPIDPAVFANLLEMTGNDNEFVDELVDTFLDDGRRQIEALQAAAVAGDVDALVRPAHSLKTGSLNVGAMRLGELCRELEETARSIGGVADADDRVAAITSAFGSASVALLQARADRPSG